MSLNTEEKIKQNTDTTNKMFDLAEKCVMQYMVQHFALTPEQLFTNTNAMQNTTQPLVLKPITSYSDNILLLQITIVPHDYVCNIPDVLKQDATINNMIGFIYHSIINVYNTILNTNINENVVQTVIEASVHLEMEDDALSMYPIYIFPERRKQLMFLQMKDDIEKTLQQFTNANVNANMQTQIQDVQTQYDELLVHINNIVYDVNIADTTEKTMNAVLATNDRIGIIFTQLKECELQDYYKTL